MAKIKMLNNCHKVFLIPIIALVVFAMVIGVSFAALKAVKIFGGVTVGYFPGNTYNLYYNVANCDPSTITNGKEYGYNGYLCDPATPDDYIFEGWYNGNTKIEDDTIVVTSQDVTLTANFVPDCINMVNKQYNFYYTGDVQNFIAKCYGTYQLEVWGAQGGTSNAYSNDPAHGGYGGYSYGIIALSSENTLYAYVGGQGESGVASSSTNSEPLNGYPNGGTVLLKRRSDDKNINIAAGGGSSHIARSQSLISDLSNNLSSLIVVAGGGGGSTNYWANIADGGAGGGYIGNTTLANYNDANPTGGTQSAGGAGGGNNGLEGSFGIGGGYNNINTRSLSGGGGGGFYGGGSSWGGSGAGGSGYINNNDLKEKFMSCYNCATSNAAATKTITSTCHSTTPTTNCAKEGNGHIRITYLGYRPTETRPQIISKTISNNNVVLGFSINQSNPKSIACYYGTDVANINTRGTVSNNTCTVPVTAAYAKVCATYDDNVLCSTNKKLAEYLIKDGFLYANFVPSVAEVEVSEANGYYHVSIGNNGRLGLVLSNFNATLYNEAYVDAALLVDARPNSDPGVNFGGAASGSFFTKDSSNVFLSSNIYKLEKTEEAVRLAIPRTTYTTTYITDATDTSTYGNANLWLGKNQVNTYEFNIDVYNIWFQLID